MKELRNEIAALRSRMAVVVQERDALVEGKRDAQSALTHMIAVSEKTVDLKEQTIEQLGALEQLGLQNLGEMRKCSTSSQETLQAIMTKLQVCARSPRALKREEVKGEPPPPPVMY